MGKFVQLKDAKTGESIYPISALPGELTDEEIEEICDFEEGMNEEDVIPKATKDLLGCVVVGDGLDVDANGVLSNAQGWELLYQNASPSSSISAATTITLAHNDYDWLLWVFRGGTASTTYLSQIIKKGTGGHITEMGFPSTGVKSFFRSITRTDDTTYSVGICYWEGSHNGVFSTGQDATYLIPYEVYGIKGVS